MEIHGRVLASDAGGPGLQSQYQRNRREEGQKEATSHEGGTDANFRPKIEHSLHIFIF